MQHRVPPRVLKGAQRGCCCARWPSVLLVCTQAPLLLSASHREATAGSSGRAAGAALQAQVRWPAPPPPHDIDVTDSDDEDVAGAACPSDDSFSDVGQPGDTEVTTSPRFG